MKGGVPGWLQTSLFKVPKERYLLWHVQRMEPNFHWLWGGHGRGTRKKYDGGNMLERNFWLPCGCFFKCKASRSGFVCGSIFLSGHDISIHNKGMDRISEREKKDNYSNS